MKDQGMNHLGAARQAILDIAFQVIALAGKAVAEIDYVAQQAAEINQRTESVIDRINEATEADDKPKRRYTKTGSKYPCRYPDCDRAFRNKLGRGQHERQKHGKVLVPSQTSRARELKCRYPGCADPTIYKWFADRNAHERNVHGATWSKLTPEQQEAAGHY